MKPSTKHNARRNLGPWTQRDERQETFDNSQRMTLPEGSKFSVGGFSGRRVGYVLAFLCLALVPAHFYVPCEVSAAIASVDMLMFLLTAILCFSAPRSTPHRLRPLAFAFAAFVGHTLCSH
jgi:hypothetical protein